MKARLSHTYLLKAINTNNELIENILENCNNFHASDATSLLSIMGVDELRASIVPQKHG
jgi:hypothetical protein